MSNIDQVKHCSISHTELAYTVGSEAWNMGKKYTVKCTNRNCYNFKLRDSDYCLDHHLRDECP